ncbi:MAG: hypothetical protein ACRD96_23515, partial [Bryobacteraceae bacterium]
MTVGIALAIPACFGQTQVDLPTQSKRVDFSQAAQTRPVKTGTALPPACLAGEMFFKTDATAGANLNGCTSTNTWTQLGGSGGVGNSRQLTDLNA